MIAKTYDGYRITELRRYATEYKIAGRSKMTGDELLVAVRAIWTAKREAGERQLLASTEVKAGTLLRHRATGTIIRVLGDVYVWQPYGSLCVDAEYVDLTEHNGREYVSRGAHLTELANEADRRRREAGNAPRHPLYQYEAIEQAEAEIIDAAAEQASPRGRRFNAAVIEGKSYRAAIDLLHEQADREAFRRRVAATRQNPQLAAGTLGGVDGFVAVLPALIEQDHAAALADDVVREARAITQDEA